MIFLIFDLINLFYLNFSEFGDEYFKFFVNGVLFIGLCSNYYYDDRDCKHLTKKQDEWLELTLKESKDLNLNHIIIFQHVPFFVHSIDEETTILNIPIKKRKSLIDKLIEYNVNTVFAGNFTHIFIKFLEEKII